MIRFLQHSEIDPEKWNQAVRNSLSPNILVEYELLNLLTGDDTWHALVQGDYEAVMPLPTRKKGVLKYVYTPFFMTQMGVFSKQPLSPNEIESFLTAVSKRFVLADIYLNCHSTPETCKCEVFSHALSLLPSYPELYSNYSKNTKRNIKTAEKMQCRVSVQQEKIENIIGLFDRNRGQEGGVHYKEKDYKILQNVSEHLLNHKLLDIYSVYTSENELAAGALFVHDHKRRWFWFSGRENRLSDCKPMFFLMDAYIRDHAGSNLILDCSTNNPNIARFYHSFGNEAYSYAFVRRFKNRLWEILLSPKLSKL